jgi:hypothetical protein
MRRYLIRVAAAAAAPAIAATLTLSAVPASAVSLSCHAWMSDSHPKDYTTDYVKVGTWRFSRIRTVAHYRTTTTTHYARANKHGRGSIAYYISGATPGYRVKVSVRVRKSGQTAYCHASFTPHS